MFFKLVYSDYKRLYGDRSLIKGLLASMVNPSFHAVFLIRCAQRCPRYFFWFFRLALISKHSIDFGVGCNIGKGLLLPHPIGIVFGGGVKMGDDNTVYQNVTFGMHKGGYPRLGNGCITYGSSVVVGAITVGDNCTIAALQFLSKNLENKTVYRK